MRVSKSILIISFVALLSLDVRGQLNSFAIQIASTRTQPEAQAIVSEMKAKGLDAYLVKAAVPRRGTRYRVRIGRFNTEIEAKAAGEQALRRGLIKEFIATAYDPPDLTQSSAPLETKPEPTKPIEQKEEPAPAIASETAPPPETIVPPPEATFELAVNNRNWKLARRGTGSDKNLQAVYFVDSITGWTAGDDGDVYRTTDGGRTWKKQLLSGSPVDLDYIYFVDWSNGWMLGGSDEEAGRLLFTTNNGGRSWRHKPLPKVMSLYFIDPLNGWAVGKDATVLRTADGGEKWAPAKGFDKVPGNFGLRDIYFLNASNGWMIGNFYNNGSSSIAGLFVTTDGGESWQRVALNIPDSSGELQSVRFTDLKSGTITGEIYDGNARFFFALHTRDGGLTWEQHRRQSRAANSTQFIDQTTGWSLASAPRESSVMHTDNGGKTWEDDFVARGGRIRKLFFLSPTTGWAVGDRGVILRYEER
jgi:photosystem II stability/assembly factor-like uncharacterized protein